MECKYDKGRGVVVIGRPVEVFLSKGDYDAVQKLTANRFGEFYTLDNSGRVQIYEGRVSKLILSKLELNTLDPAIWDLTALRWLDVSGNKLPYIPDAIGNLRALQRLEVEGNPLNEQAKELLERLKDRKVRVFY